MNHSNHSNHSRNDRAPSGTGRRRGRVARTVAALVAAGAVATGGAVLAHGDRDGGRMVGHLSDRLELDDSQAQALGALVDEVSGLRGTLRGDGLRDELAALAAGPTLDQAGALALIESRSDALRAAAPGLVAAAAAFHDGLDERQRAEVAGMLERVGDRGDRGGRGRHRDGDR